MAHTALPQNRINQNANHLTKHSAIIGYIKSSSNIDTKISKNGNLRLEEKVALPMGFYSWSKLLLISKSDDTFILLLLNRQEIIKISHIRAPHRISPMNHNFIIFLLYHTWLCFGAWIKLNSLWLYKCWFDIMESYHGKMH